MKKIKIYSVPSHASKERTSGVDFARIIQPMEALNGYKLDDTEFEVKVYDIHKDEGKAGWPEIAKEYDIVYLNYTAEPWGFAAMGAMVRKYNRLMVLDVDDSIWHVQKDNPSYIAYHKGSEGLANFTSICNEVDYMTTTNSYLRNVIVHNTKKLHDHIKVFPNYIDLDKVYTYRPKFKDTHEINLLHFGTTTHFIDLANEEFGKGVDRIFKEYPNVNLKTVGAFLPAYKRRWGNRYNNAFGHMDVKAWIKDKFPLFMDETDILVTPLEDNMYTRCKSSIKFLEGSSAMKVGVWQDVRQYREVVRDEVNGMLAQNNADSWYKAIKKLIDNKELRMSMGRNALKTVQAEWQMKDHVKDYAQYFKDILTRHENNSINR